MPVRPVSVTNAASGHFPPTTQAMFAALVKLVNKVRFTDIALTPGSLKTVEQLAGAYMNLFETDPTAITTIMVDVDDGLSGDAAWTQYQGRISTLVNAMVTAGVPRKMLTLTLPKTLP